MIFLELLASREPIPSVLPARTLSYKPSDATHLTLIEAEIRRTYFQNSRVFGVTETRRRMPKRCYALLASSYPHSVYLYHAGQPADEHGDEPMPSCVNWKRKEKAIFF